MNAIIDDLKRLLDTLIRQPEMVEIFVPEGKPKQASRQSLGFENHYKVTVFIKDFSINYLVIIAYVLRWYNAHTRYLNDSQWHFEYDIDFYRSTDVFLAFELSLMERIGVTENEDGSLNVGSC